MASLDHLSLTNKNPKHDKCSAGSDSWCKWRKVETACAEKEFNHSPSLYLNVLKHLIPIYENLSRDDLLIRCLDGYTQNSNESFNSTVSNSKTFERRLKLLKLPPLLLQVYLMKEHVYIADDERVRNSNWAASEIFR
ncbi:hypothetical protein ACFW04_011899 [Cataglyphis niger]